jgi:hypothetical protein
MKRVVMLAIVWLTVFHCSSSSLVTSSKTRIEPIEWWANIWPDNPRYIEVKVQVKDPFCVKPVLPFSVRYFNENGTAVGTLTNNFVVDQSEVCSGTYVRYFEITTTTAKTTGHGTMSWSLVGPRPFSGSTAQKKP